MYIGHQLCCEFIVDSQTSSSIQVQQGLVPGVQSGALVSEVLDTRVSILGSRLTLIAVLTSLTTGSSLSDAIIDFRIIVFIGRTMETDGMHCFERFAHFDYFLC